MAINIKSKEVDRLARELVTLRKGSSITEAVEFALREQIAREVALNEARLLERAKALQVSTARNRAMLVPDQDPRPLTDIRDELWGGL